MRIRCLTGVLGRVTLLIAASSVATAVVAGQVIPLPGAPAAQAVSGGSVESMAVESVAVVPFTNISRNERDDWLGHGIAETVAADLETRDAFTVVALERVAAAMGGVAANRDDTAAAALGRELGSRWVVAGGYQRVGDRLRITARLVDTLSGTLAATARVDGAFADIFDLQDRIAGELTRGTGARAALVAAPAPPAGVGRAPFDGGRADLGRVARGGGRVPIGPASEGDVGFVPPAGRGRPASVGDGAGGFGPAAGGRPASVGDGAGGFGPAAGGRTASVGDGAGSFGPAAGGRAGAFGDGAGGFDFERAIRAGRTGRVERRDPGLEASPRAGAGNGEVTGGIILPPSDPANRAGPGELSRRGPETPLGGTSFGGPPPGAAARLGAGGPRPGGPAAGAATPRAPAAGLAPAASLGILAGRPNVTAVRTAQPPTIDGNLDDSVWQRATRITEFVQQSPLEGQPATEDTEVYVAYDDEHIYFGLYAHYSEPSMMRANRVDRDQAFFGDDIISVYFDPFLDQQRAYVFSVNGYGVQNDSILEARFGSGSSGRSSRGGGFSMGGRSSFTGVRWGDRSWDALYETGGTVVDDGWTAEMAIPFKSLRYPSNPTHRWGFQIARRIRGKDETVVWSPMSRDVSGLLPQMGVLDGLSDLSTSRNLEILPTATAIRVDTLDRSAGGLTEAAQPEGGVNLKYGVTSNLTLDVTYNPDFSQIESDRPQIEVNQRFPLFYPEMRPFFLEGQEIFNMPGPVNFVHTRTIVDPRYGGKLTGKVGNTTMGVLVANDEAPGNLGDAYRDSDFRYGKTADVVIGRVRYDLYAESHIGAIVTDREFLGGYSRLGGLDGNFRLNDATSVGFRAITSQNRDCGTWDAAGCGGAFEDTAGNMFDVGLRSNGRNLTYFVAGYTIDPEFDTAVGFVRRRDIKAGTGNVGYRWWPESWLINWGPTFNYTRNWNFENVLEDEMANAGVNFSFAKNIRVNAGYSRDMERFGGINFDKEYYSLGGNVSTIRELSIGGFFSYGDQVRYDLANPANSFLGAGGRGGVFMSLRPFSRLQSQVNISTSNLIDPFSDTEIFDVKIYRALTTFQFTDRLLLRNILEYNTFQRTMGANVLFTYRINSGTVFFIGYDDRYQQGDLIFDRANSQYAYLGNPVFYTTDLMRTNRAFFTKISYLFRY